MPEPHATGRGLLRELNHVEGRRLVVAPWRGRGKSPHLLARGVLRGGGKLRDAIVDLTAELADRDLSRRIAFERAINGENCLRPDRAVDIDGSRTHDVAPDDQC